MKLTPTKPNKVREYLVLGHASVLNFLNGTHGQFRFKGRIRKDDQEIVKKLFSNIELGSCQLCTECEKERKKEEEDGRTQ